MGREARVLSSIDLKSGPRPQSFAFWTQLRRAFASGEDNTSRKKMREGLLGASWEPRRSAPETIRTSRSANAPALTHGRHKGRSISLSMTRGITKMSASRSNATKRRSFDLAPVRWCVINTHLKIRSTLYDSVTCMTFLRPIRSEYSPSTSTVASPEKSLFFGGKRSGHTGARAVKPMIDVSLTPLISWSASVGFGSNK